MCQGLVRDLLGSAGVGPDPIDLLISLPFTLLSSSSLPSFSASSSLFSLVPSTIYPPQAPSSRISDKPQKMKSLEFCSRRDCRPFCSS